MLFNLAAALIALVATVSGVSASGRYVVGLNEGVDVAKHMQWARGVVHERNLERRGEEGHVDTDGVETTFRRLGGYVGSFDAATVEEIRGRPDVAYIEEDQIYDLFQTATLLAGNSDPVIQTNSTWGLSLISHRNFTVNATSYVYDASAGEGGYAYVLDSGINVAHVEFGGRASLGYNAVGAQTPESHYDNSGHGTHVAGTIGSSTYGVAKKAHLVSVKISNDTGYYFSALIDGLDWVLDDAIANDRLNNSVVNISGGGPYSQAVANACNQAYRMGLTIVASAGNGNRDTSWVSPAGGPGVLGVASVGRERVRAELSNWGPSVDVFAPGEATLSTWIGNETAVNVINGTSMASPHVAGTVLYLQTLEGLGTPDLVLDRIIELSIKDVVVDAQGSPNRLLYTGAA
ncbi:allergen Asp fl 1 [Pleomassaria siparia CBS 279.74]|uniref:Allergen Asp fl 1 n=1 Tax=Pleomassaria siparia CBS 279.74 TaxID=1314801 RepID=A0A6G1K094_9PLEO|nr:allergen Asp fl 1 [Pleomassaria siparia CBS 279.74]